jgi:hypothetical protein
VLTHVSSRFSCFNSHVSIAQKKIPRGGTIASVSIFTDETHLTNFAGGKKAHPVYATINNIEKSFRRNERGEQLFPDHTGRIPLREVRCTRAILGIVDATGVQTNTFKREGLRECRPFWADLPHTDIFMAITPDILHQLHNGVIGEHLIPWLQEIIEDLDEDALDDRFQAQSQP